MKKACREKSTFAHIDAVNLCVKAGDDYRCIASPGLIPVQPKDRLSLGEDELSAAGDYSAPNPFNGKIISCKVTAHPPTKLPSQTK